MMRRITTLAVLIWLLVACGQTAVNDTPSTATPPPSHTPTPPPSATPIPSTTPTTPPTATAVSQPTPHTPPDLAYLAAAIEQTLSQFTGLSSYFIKDLRTGNSISRNPDLALAGMSLIKIPILVTTYSRLDHPPDIEQTKLITQTTALSSNFAANLLLQLIAGQPDPFLGADTVSEEMRQLGLYNTFMTVPYDKDPLPDRLNTYLTPANQRTDITTHPDPFRQTTLGDLSRLLEMIYTCANTDRGPLRQFYAARLTQAECAEMLHMLRLNELVLLLEAGLPPDTPIAHKLGYIDDTYGDVGIVYSPGGNYLIGLALYYPGWLEWGIASPLFAAVSRLTYAHFNDPLAYDPAVLARPPALTPTVPPPPTPDLPAAIVAGTRGVGLTLRQTPGGAEIAILPEGTVVRLLPAPPQIQNGLTWQQVRTPDGWEGWVGADYLAGEP